MNRIEAQRQALRYFTLDGTDHRSHEEQNSMIRRYVVWRNRNAHDRTLRELVERAKRCLIRHLSAREPTPYRPPTLTELDAAQPTRPCLSDAPSNGGGHWRLEDRRWCGTAAGEKEIEPIT